MLGRFVFTAIFEYTDTRGVKPARVLSLTTHKNSKVLTIAVNGVGRHLYPSRLEPCVARKGFK
jgi:hypothetical protein